MKKNSKTANSFNGPIFIVPETPKSKRKFCVCAVVPLVVEYLPENHKEFK